MRLLFLGDSITQGVGASCEAKNYVSLVREMLGCEALNYGVSGTRIGRQTQLDGRTHLFAYDFRLRAEIMEEEADLVFVFGGTNDFGHGRLHLGSPEEREGRTFCTELRLLIDLLIAKYGKEKLCFLLPLRRFSEEGVACKGESGKEVGATLAEYVTAMREILGEYGIESIDLYENGFPKPLVSTGDEYTKDGLHPNDNGYVFLANIICDYVREKMAR